MWINKKKKRELNIWDMRATARQVSPGCASLRTRSLMMKDPAGFSLTHTGPPPTAHEKLVSQTHCEEYKQQIRASDILYIAMFTTFVYFIHLRKMAWSLLVVLWLFFNYYVQLQGMFLRLSHSIFFPSGDPNQ